MADHTLTPSELSALTALYHIVFNGTPKPKAAQLEFLRERCSTALSKLASKP